MYHRLGGRNRSCPPAKTAPHTINPCLKGLLPDLRWSGLRECVDEEESYDFASFIWTGYGGGCGISGFILDFSGGQRWPRSFPPPSDLAELSAQAQQAQRRGDYHRAAEIYLEMLDSQPHLPEVRSNLGLMYHFLGDYPQAVSTFELALHDAPQLYVANLFLGLDLLNLHQPQKALSFLERACDLNRHDAQAQVGLGEAYVALGSENKARIAYERAAQIDTKSSDAWYGLGGVYLDLQESAVDRLAATGKESPYARDLVAHSLLEQGQADAAVNIYRDLLRSQQPLPCVGANLGFAYTLAEDLRSAQQAFQNERENHPGCLLARLGQARVLLAQSNDDEAITELFGLW